MRAYPLPQSGWRHPAERYKQCPAEHVSGRSCSTPRAVWALGFSLQTTAV